MYNWLGFLLGGLGVIGLLWLTRAVRARGARPGWYLWLGLVAWYGWTVTGIFFVLDNLLGRHVKAATVGAFLFFFLSVATGALLARLFLQGVKRSV